MFGKLAIGLGLTALAAGGVYIAARGKGGLKGIKQLKEVIEDGERFTVQESGRWTYYKDMQGKVRKLISKGEDGSVDFINKYSKDTGFLTEQKSFGPNRAEIYFDGTAFVDDVFIGTNNYKSILKSISYYDDKLSSVVTYWPGTAKIKTKIIYTEGKVQSYNKMNPDGAKRFYAFRSDIDESLVAALPDGKGGSIYRKLTNTAREGTERV